MTLTIQTGKRADLGIVSAEDKRVCWNDFIHGTKPLWNEYEVEYIVNRCEKEKRSYTVTRHNGLHEGQYSLQNWSGK